MPFPCFSYPADLPPNVTSRGAAQRVPRGPAREPGYPCFSYPDDVPPGTGNRGGAQPGSPELRRMPYPCFRY